VAALGIAWAVSAAAQMPSQAAPQTIDLPTSKQLIGEIPGKPERLNSLPMTMAVSPDGRYVVTVNAGYGTAESNYEQSLAVLDTQTGKLEDFPDARTVVGANQTLYAGLAFSRDGAHLYASMGSTTDPVGKEKDDTGNGIVVYSFAGGKIAPDRFIPVALQQLAPGRKTKLVGDVDGDKGVPFPAAIAVVGPTRSHCDAMPAESAGMKQCLAMGWKPGGDPQRGEWLLVADNLSDDVVLMESRTGSILKRFDLSESNAVPSTYPIALAVSKDGSRAFVALWNASEIVELDLWRGDAVPRKLVLLKPSSPIAPGTHPCALAFSRDEKTLYVALANRDAVAAVEVGGAQFSVKGYFDTRLPHQTYFGAEPEALAVNGDGSRLYVGNAISDSIAVFDTKKLTTTTGRLGMAEPMGFVPTEWMPMAMAFIPAGGSGDAGGRLYVATAKGHGTGPNNMAQAVTGPDMPLRMHRPRTYIGTLLHGSLATLDADEIEKNLPAWTENVIESNRMKAAAETVTFAQSAKGESTTTGKNPGNNSNSPRIANPIKHVIYIIKENRTYDQIFGDLKRDGKPVGNGDKSLTMYGEAVTPNLHRLALQFGVLDNFFDSGEVSGDGHVWSTAAIGTDYLEKTWEQNYRGGQRTYDWEGMVADGYPLQQRIADVAEPASGYLWGDLAKHGKSYYHFGEYISTKFCDEVKTANPQAGPMVAGPNCARQAIAPGEAIPEEWGGGVNKWPWAIPLIATNVATKPELVGHFAMEAPDFDLMVPDQVRVEIFLRHLKGWLADKAKGKDTMPNFVMLRLGNDHTAGTRTGAPTPKASVADNDLAVGRAVEAISHSPYWDDTAFFILEDDAQDGADHVDAHRSIGLVVSKYAPMEAYGGVFVDSRFYSTVSMVRTMEALLGLPPMNNNDAFAPLISPIFSGPGNQPAYTADTSNRDNGLIYTANAKTAPGAKESAKMDFRHADHADAGKLNVILWQDAMGDKPVPAMLKEKRKKTKEGDDD
jgi:DNA-binding beta-propeller fold protein YncE